MSKQSKIPSEKAQSKKPDKTKSEAWMSRWDWDRQEGPDLRDPRNAGPPCEGTHSPALMGRGSPSGCNAHGLWVTCSRCSMRPSCTPAIGAKACYRASPPLAADIKATLKGKGQQCGSFRTDDSVHQCGCRGKVFAAEARTSSGREERDSQEAGGKEASGDDRNRRQDGCQDAGLSLQEDFQEGEHRASGEPRSERLDGCDRKCREPSIGVQDGEAREIADWNASGTLLSSSEIQFLEQSLTNSCNELQEIFSQFEVEAIDMIEVCCGPDSSLIATLEQKGGKGGRVGLHNNMNITTEFGLSRARNFCETMKPRYLWLSPICGPTSPVQHLNSKTEEQRIKLEKKKKISRKMAKGCVKLAKDQIRRGGHIVWEWPKSNGAWKFKEVQQLFHELSKHGLIFDAVLDGCMVGVVAPDCGIPMPKPWKLRTTDSVLADVMSISCDGRHDHVECMGNNRVESSAFYPKKMCSLVVRHVLSTGFGFTGNVSEVFGEDFEGDQNTTKGEGSFGKGPSSVDGYKDTPIMTPKELRDLKETIHRLHVRSGHPTNQALVNCLRARGVPKHVLDLAKEHKCDSCHEVKLPQPHSKVSFNKTELLWHTIQMDIGQLKVGQQVVHFLLVMDEASHFAIAHELFRTVDGEHRNSTTSEVIRALEVGWVQVHGFPNVLRVRP